MIGRVINLLGIGSAVVVIVLSVLPAISGCSGNVSGGGDADIDTDADSDSDTDTDVDADTDTDSDADTDVDADADTDSDADTDVDADTDTDTSSIPEYAIFVDPEISTSRCNDYSPGARACGTGDRTAYRSISDAADAAKAGDTVVLRQGDYSEQLRPQSSGEESLPMTFMAYPGEEVVFTGSLRPAIDLTGRKYIVIKGFVIRRTARWIYLDDAHHNIVQDNKFLGATDEGAGSKSGIFLRNAKFNKILDNLIQDSPEDSMALVSADNNLVQGNTFRNAGHALFAVRCGNYNVFRGNYFYNDYEKDGEIYDCDGQGGVTRYDATKRNLVEANEFDYVPSSGNSSPYSGIQFAGQDTIIRRNVFHSTVGPGLSMSLYGREARHNTGNRIYNNVFHGTDFAGVAIARGDTMEENVFKNNVFSGSTFVANDTRWNWWVDVLDGKHVQILASRLDGFVLDHNCIFYDNDHIGEPWLITYGWRSTDWDEQRSVSWWEQDHPDLVMGSLEADPMFADPDSADFKPSLNSPLVDAGTFLTVTTGSGSGEVLPVEDASWFYDGYGIQGEAGDKIRLEGTDQTATVVSVDIDARTITLDREVSFTAGQGVALDYKGLAPDIGAYEVK